MKILAIESSCDETSASVLEKDKSGIKVISNVTATSLQIHATTGGIIPETAARMQVKYILPVIMEALLSSRHSGDKQSEDAGIDHNQKRHTETLTGRDSGSSEFSENNWTNARQILRTDIDAIAVTYGPGLIGSLLVGVETAKTLAYIFNKPLIPVNHLLAHIYANFISANSKFQIPNSKKLNPKRLTLDANPFPFIGLIVSGGHTDLLFFEGTEQFTWLGGTRDDAAGECFDKCARLIGFDYPGGPKISALAKKGIVKKGLLPKVMVGDDFDFSFSGLKTAFMNIVKKEFVTSKDPNQKGYSFIHTDIGKLEKDKQQLLYDLCASLEMAITEVLVRKTLKAAEKYNVNSILIGGGVSANQTFTDKLKLDASHLTLNPHVFSPEKTYCTDNAAMIGAYALMNFKTVKWNEVTANPELYFA